MLGEIRDKETAELCIRAALTGHLVLSTLHTNDAAGITERLNNMDIPSYLTASVLKGAVAQRLIKSEKNGGRVIVSEVFASDSRTEALICEKASKEELASYLKKSGMKTIKEDALEKIKKGIITKNAASREIEGL